MTLKTSLKKLSLDAQNANFPAAKSLFNDYPCFTMSIIVAT